MPKLNLALGVFLLLLATALAAQEPTLRVIEIRGAHPGPTVALIAGVHGGKVSASQALERLARRLEQQKGRMNGRVRIVPVANEAARQGGAAQLGPDGLNLNRVFPGKADGRPTERLARRILYEVVAGADYLVDLHGSDGEEAVGRFAYAARPGLRPAIDSAALELARAWGTPLVVWDTAGPRTLATSIYLQTAAHLSSVPAITVFEAGTTRDDAAAVDAFLQGAERLLGSLGMIVHEPEPMAPPAVMAERAVMTSDDAGTWRPLEGRLPGTRVKHGESLGFFADSSVGPGGSTSHTAHLAPANGIILHIRQPGPVSARTPLFIIAVEPH